MRSGTVKKLKGVEESEVRFIKQSSNSGFLLCEQYAYCLMNIILLIMGYVELTESKYRYDAHQRLIETLLMLA
jgi:hypothetical protein